MISNNNIDNILGRTGRRTCIICGSNELFFAAIILQKGIAPELPGHEISYSHSLIAYCPDCRHSILERLIHDCFDWEDVWDDRYEWFIFNKANSERLQQSLTNCPMPLSSKCYCDIHRSLRSSMFYFPIDSWNWVIEETPNVYKAKLDIRNGLPRIEADIKRKPR